MENSSWVTWEYYLIWLGERSVDYAYTKEILLDNLEYFKKCYNNHLSTYKALEFFSFELDEKLL